jgi:hypothetical protein
MRCGDSSVRIVRADGVRDWLRRSALYRPYVREKLARSSRAREEHFTGFWRDNVWGDSESRSGSGSRPETASGLGTELSAVLRELGVTSLLDAPCGDFTWMQHVPLDGIRYIGGDIVGAMVAELQEKYGGPMRSFCRLDLIVEPLPAVDAVLVRDLFLHLPNASILRAMRNVSRSDARYLLASTYPQTGRNDDVEMGSHRFPDLTLAPFSLPTPLRQLADPSPERPDKALGVWTLDAVRVPLDGARR